MTTIVECCARSRTNQLENQYDMHTHPLHATGSVQQKIMTCSRVLSMMRLRLKKDDYRGITCKDFWEHNGWRYIAMPKTI